MKATDIDSGLTWDRINEFLEVYPDSGHFVWKVWRGGSAKPGTLAGTTNSSEYPIIKIDGRFYLSHRLMWFYVHKRWPEQDIDHINLDKADNRIENLREASRSQNIANGRVRRDSQSGVRGVKKMGNRFGAFVRKDGVQNYLGCYATPEEAGAVYAEHAKRLFGEFART